MAQPISEDDPELPKISTDLVFSVETDERELSVRGESTSLS
jgi:hypothetical protein